MSNTFQEVEKVFRTRNAEEGPTVAMVRFLNGVKHISLNIPDETEVHDGWRLCPLSSLYVSVCVHCNMSVTASVLALRLQRKSGYVLHLGRQLSSILTLSPESLQRENQHSHGETSREEFVSILDATYAEVAHWRRNTFSVSFWSGGRNFVTKCLRCISCLWLPSLEVITLKAAVVLPILLLQNLAKVQRPKNTSVGSKGG